jgi:hypothetical protein
MLKHLLPILLSMLLSTTLWAGSTPSLLFENSFADMTYPSATGNYMVYNQRVGKNHQIMQIRRDDLYGAAKDVSANFEQEVVKYGAALSNGDFAYVSNRTGQIIPWLHHNKQEVAVQAVNFLEYCSRTTSMFQPMAALGYLIPL